MSWDLVVAFFRCSESLKVHLLLESFPGASHSLTLNIINDLTETTYTMTAWPFWFQRECPIYAVMFYATTLLQGCLATSAVILISVFLPDFVFSQGDDKQPGKAKRSPAGFSLKLCFSIAKYLHNTIFCSIECLCCFDQSALWLSSGLVLLFPMNTEQRWIMCIAGLNAVHSLMAVLVGLKLSAVKNLERKLLWNVFKVIINHPPPSD